MSESQPGGLIASTEIQYEAKASSVSAPQLKCVCLNSPFEECDVQPSCPHLFIPVASLHCHREEASSHHEK